jgi:hypothetical protein
MSGAFSPGITWSIRGRGRAYNERATTGCELVEQIFGAHAARRPRLHEWFQNFDASCDALPLTMPRCRL